MAEVAIKTPLQYLDKASSALRDLGLMPDKIEPTPINALLETISETVSMAPVSSLRMGRSSFRPSGAMASTIR